MNNIYFIQLAGILLTAGGLAALTASAYVYGRPLTSDEKAKASRENRNSHLLPINLATIAATAFVLAGAGVLTWSEFNICSYLGYWMPNLPEGLLFFLTCR